MNHGTKILIKTNTVEKYIRIYNKSYKINTGVVNIALNQPLSSIRYSKGNIATVF